ncbi:YheC/D like ATP-grasp [Paenibacillus uliginis N3/975]|uniref:YheC/D like ATP-grasp n=1 Tax=Paenibacillus uliginis N3/975 TaxID=1313296 RepID=A0A1X7GYK9_9BACL|nr:YheC/YheD family protein [Paenibacillus uliginis]SMF76522.1 YheC/D like ATP-grasp [Paenibacillus uliginis N3/975]
MSLTFSNVHFSHQPEKVVFMSGSLMRSLGLTSRRQIQLRLGRNAISASLKPIERSGKHLYLSSGIRNSVHVPRSGPAYVHMPKDGEIQIGPVVGVLSDGPSSPSSPFGARTAYIKQLLREGNKKMYVYAFAPGDINWQRETVYAYLLSANGQFVRKTVPLPDVVYNRLPSRRTDFSPFTNQLRDRFMKRNISFFNWAFFNKADIYNQLENDVQAGRYVPETYSNPSPERIKDMLERHRFVYYKPSAGSLGNGIYRLTYQPKKGYFARYRSTGGNTLLKFPTFTSLMRLLQSRHGSGLRNYVIQQGIRLIEIDGCPIDFRFHMHKDGRNRWSTVGIGAKKAGRGSVTTHIKNGGQLMTPEQALGRTFGSKSREVLERAKQTAVTLAEAIENHHSHVLAEIGFDIGIDEDEKIWMFEANSKPGRSIFSHPSLRVEGKASVEHIFEHCLYLGGFHRGE